MAWRSGWRCRARHAAFLTTHDVAARERLRDGRHDVSPLLHALSVLLGVASAGFAVMAPVEDWRAVRIGGSRLIFNGWDWFVMSDRVPAAARPHIRRALARWGLAMLCLLLAGIAATLSGTA